MTDLRDALHGLADEPRPAPAPGIEPAELWSRGVRRRRWRAAAAVAATIAVVAAGAGVGLLVHDQPDTPPPADGTSHGPHLPKSIGVPDPGSAGSADAGPPGRLAVLWRAPRDGHDGAAFFGVTAAGGTYRFLDLPRLAGPQDVALSPDGREVAYWTTGSVTGAAIRVVGAEHDMATVAGIARHDTVTGKTRFHPIPSEHGVEPEGIRWTDDDTVLFQYGVIASARAVSDVAHWSWGRHGGPRYQVHGLDLDGWTSAQHGGHVMRFGNIMMTLPVGAVTRPANALLTRIPLVAWGDFTTNGTDAAGVEVGPDPDTITDTGALRVGRTRNGQVKKMTRVAGLKVLGIIGWTGPRDILVVTKPRDNPPEARLVRVDVRTGAVHGVGTIRTRGQWPGAPQYATDLLTTPVVARAVPDWREDDWTAAGWGGLVALVVAGGAVLVWRRRARG